MCAKEYDKVAKLCVFFFFLAFLDEENKFIINQKFKNGEKKRSWFNTELTVVMQARLDSVHL